MDLKEQINANYGQIMSKINGTGSAAPSGTKAPAPKPAAVEKAAKKAEESTDVETGEALGKIVGQMTEHPERIPQIEAEHHLSELSDSARSVIFYDELEKLCDRHRDAENHDQAMCCAEAMLHYSNHFGKQLLTLYSLRNILAAAKLISVKGSSFEASGLLGSVKTGLNTLQSLKEKNRGSAGRLLGNLVVLALFLAAAGALWFYPPVHSWMMSYLPGVYSILAAIICIIVFFSSGSFLGTGALIFVFALLAAGYTKFIPEDLQYPIGVYGTKILVTLALIVLFWLLAGDSLRRNWYAATHGAERSENRRRYRELYGQLSRHISTMEARVQEMQKHIRDMDPSVTEVMDRYEGDTKQFIHNIKENGEIALAYYSKAKSELKSLGTL